MRGGHLTVLSQGTDQPGNYARANRQGGTVAAFSEKKVISAGSMTGTAVLTSDISDLRGLTSCSYQMVWTSTAVGAFTFEVSNSYGDIAGATWTVLTLDSAPTDPAGSASSTGCDFVNLGYRWIRMKYTNASSTGTLNVWFFGRGN